MPPDQPRRYVTGPPRDEKLSLDVLRRVMPRKEPEDVPRDPTLLEVLTQGFYEGARPGDESGRLRDDGKQR